MRNDFGLKKSRFTFILKHNLIVRNGELCPLITLQRDLAAKWKRGTTAQKGTKLWRVISAEVTGTVA